MEKSQKVITNYYFPRFIRIGSLLLLAIGFLGFNENAMVAMLALLFWIMIQTTHNGIEIDSAKKLYRKYLSVLGFEFGSFAPYKKIEGLNIDKVNGVNKSDVYQGYVNFSETGYLPVVQNASKEKVLAVLRKISEAFDLEIVDETISS